MKNRRDFLKQSALLMSGLAAGRGAGAHTYRSDYDDMRGFAANKELSADLMIIGGGTGGVSAAISALKLGLRVVMTEETDWIGGQLTAQAVPPDENPWIETFGGSGLYQEYRRRVRDYYKTWYPVTAEQQTNEFLNPGNGWVSRISHEPQVSLAVLEAMLAPWVSSGQLTILRECRPVGAETDGDRVTAVEVLLSGSGDRMVLHAPWFIDATETGELLKLASVEYVLGAEGRDQTGEPHAPAQADPDNVQAFNLCFLMDYIDGEDFTIEKPEDYAYWSNFTPELNPPWPGKLFSFTYTHPISMEPRTLPFDPKLQDGWWAYRQVLDPANFMEGFYGGPIACINWPQHAYLGGRIVDEPEETVKYHLSRAVQLNLSLIYWLQTEAPRPDGGAGWPGLRLRGDIFNTPHGMAKHAYIRESRRIKARFTVLEQHVGTVARMNETGLAEDDVRAAIFEDSVGIGAYRIDLHPSTKGNNYIDISSLPFQIPLGALIPQRVRNVVPACKNIGTTHITNGCYRLQPVEWNIGESAGALIGFCKMKQSEPHQVYEQKELLRDYQQTLEELGVRLSWPQDQVHAL
ncbi:MAG: FAD-dependent oxidoreductase [Balneolaceae bacterium]|nr:MAG: FAD-dependent oxidoreductase [Balneolaceae bacterium]